MDEIYELIIFIYDFLLSLEILESKIFGEKVRFEWFE
jgi:hypothetical protein